MIKAIAFDFGGTLFSTGKMGAFTPSMTETFVGQTTKHLNCTQAHAELIFSKYVEAWKARRMRASHLPENEISSLELFQSALASANQKLDKTKAIDILNQFHVKESEQFTPLNGVLSTLPMLAKNGYRLCVVSNNPWSESIRASFRAHNIENFFEHIVVSCDVGYRKPSKKIFDALINKLSILPSEILFVGDSHPHDIETPKKMGMKTCLVDFEGKNKNQQKENAAIADFFITEFERLVEII